MKDLLEALSSFFQWAISEKCELCHGRLRKKGDRYYGGLDVKDTIGGDKTRKAYVCNLCYQLFVKSNA